MSKFKVGDRVRKQPGEYEGFTTGSRYNLPGSVGTIVDGCDGFLRIDYDGCLSPPVNPNAFELVQSASPSPVRTKTVKEIVPGTYGPVHVGYNLTTHGYVSVSLASSVFNADGLSDIINTLTPIRDALADATEA